MRQFSFFLTLSFILASMVCSQSHAADLYQLVQNQPGGGTINLPAGNHTISQTITLQSTFQIVGADQATTIIKFTGSGTSAIFVNADDCLLQNLTLDLNGNANRGGIEPKSKDVKGFTCRDVSFRGVPGNAVYIGATGSGKPLNGLVVENCDFIGGRKAIILLNRKSQKTGRITSVPKVSITGSSFLGGGITLDCANDAERDITDLNDSVISGNTFSGADFGVGITMAKNVLIENNSFADCDEALHCEFRADSISFINNNITLKPGGKMAKLAPGDSKVYIRTFGSIVRISPGDINEHDFSVNGCTNCVVAGNTVTGSTVNAVLIREGKGCVVMANDFSGVTFDRNGERSIKLESGTATGKRSVGCINCTVKNNVGVSNSGVEVQLGINNTITGNN